MSRRGYYCGVIAPQPGEGSNSQTSRGALVRRNLAVAALIFVLLQVWRPCFFLTDDNLDGGYPIFMEMGNHLLHGRSPFYSDYLFGGHYNLLRDATFFSWHPVYLLVSLLAATPFHFWIIDLDAFIFIMLANAGFVNLAWHLRREMSLSVSDGWIMFYSLSFTYSIIALTTGAGWLSFLVNQSALPWLAFGILQKNWRWSVTLVAAFVLHQILGGHPLATVANTVFLTLFATGVSLTRRSFAPLACWGAGYVLALIVLMPLVIPLMEGFFATARAQGIALDDMQRNNIPPLLFPTSLFVGMALWTVHPPENGHVTYLLAFGSCAAAWNLFPALLSRARWRGLEWVCVGLMLFAIVMITRPIWITEGMSHVPLLRSMRWPFRELLQFQFFFHLFLLLRPPGWNPRSCRGTALFSTLIMLGPMVFYPPPTLNAMTLDRNLLFSGEFDRYWAVVRTQLKPEDRVAVMTSYPLYLDDRHEKPNCLYGPCNFLILARVINVSGYSHTAPSDQQYVKTVPFFPNGTFEISQKAALLRERPDLKFITLESVHPLRITLSSKQGPVIDLAPDAPAEVRGE